MTRKIDNPRKKSPWPGNEHAATQPEQKNAEPAFGPLPKELIAAIQDVYEPAGMQLTEAAKREPESQEYGACRFRLDGHSVVFRVAKTTPAKIGQFVTLWKRPTPASIIAPLDTDDGIAFVVVSVFDETNRGQFIFDRQVLASKGIMAINGKGGKRAIRVYPPWSKPVAAAAMKTQQWQLRYFLSIEPGANTYSAQVRRLFEGQAPDPSTLR